MPSILYSTTCYIKSDLYRVSIYTEDEGSQTSSDIVWTTDLSQFTSTDIPLDTINPSLTRINFELVNEKKSTTPPKTIILNHLLNVQQILITPSISRRKLNNFSELINTDETSTPPNKYSQQTSHTTLNTSASQVTISQTPVARRQFNFGRLHSNQSCNESETNSTVKTGITLSYVHISDTIRWSIKRLELVAESEDIANDLCANIKLCLSTLKQRPHHLLAFVNPFGGKGQAQFVYEKRVLPIFKEANITVNSIYTERANQAQNYVINEDLNDYDGLVCVGGDGMFAELCHGLLLRTSIEAQLNIDDPHVNVISPSLRIGIIPAGSTDAVVFGTTGLNDPVTSALQIAIGESLPIDIATVHNEKGFVRFMATMLAYGFFGDIIHQSDKWRFLGPLRYDLAGFCQFIRNKSYHSELTITLSPHDSSQRTHLHSDTPVNTTAEETKSSETPDSVQFSKNINPITHGTHRIDKPLQAIDKLVTPAPVFCSRNCETCAMGRDNHSHEIHSPVKIKREGKYTTINCLNMPCRCAKSKYGMSPFVHLGDGSFDLILVKRSWLTGFLRFLWQVANDSRSIEDLPNVERYHATEVIIRAMHTDRRRFGNWTCDGELISGNEIQIRIHRQVLSLFASGIQFNKIEEYRPEKRSKRKKCCSCFRTRKHKTDQQEQSNDSNVSESF